MQTSAVVPGNTCPELCGAVDKFGAIYAGPKCDGCDQCTGLEPIKIMLRKLPYKPCFIVNHDHQMALCGGCGHNGFHNGPHWYCPDLTYRSGEHVSPLDSNGTPREATPADDLPDEDL